MTVQTTLKFRDLIKAVCDLKKLTQHQLAFHSKVSQTAISLVGSHQRKLSTGLAGELSKVLGQTPEFWLDAYDRFESETVSDLTPFLDQISGGFRKGQTLGVGTKRLLNTDILDLFDPKNATADCKIKGFDPRRIGTACYYCRLGFIERDYLMSADEDVHDPTTPIMQEFSLAPGERVTAVTLETFHFPLWIEAEFHAASALYKHGLRVDNGPTIDPGYEKRLYVMLENASDREVVFDTKSNFLKLRFTVFDSAAQSADEFVTSLDQNITDADIIAAATAEEA